MKYPWLTFGDVKVGERFRFVYNPLFSPYVSAELYEKRSSGWYRAVGSEKSYRTGRTSTIVLEK